MCCMKFSPTGPETDRADPHIGSGLDYLRDSLPSPTLSLTPNMRGGL
jgi:hypothetical protein